MNALKLISARAKQLRKANKRLTQVDAIKKASVDYRAGRLGAVKRPKQTGSSNTVRDKQRKAKPPGKRKSKQTGRVYSERRKNRSDAPGKITGIPSQLQRELDHVHQAEAHIWKLRNTSKRGMTSMQVQELKRQLEYHRKARLVHKANLRNLKRLI